MTDTLNISPVREKINSLKNYLKSKKQHYQQKKNWAKYRFNYLRGIHSYLNRNTLNDKKGTILDRLIKYKKQLIKENILLSITQNEKDVLLPELIEILYPVTERIINEYSKILYCNTLVNLYESLYESSYINKYDFLFLLSFFQEQLQKNVSFSILENSDDDILNKFLSIKGLNMNLVEEILGLSEAVVSTTPSVVQSLTDVTTNTLDLIYSDNTPPAQISNISGVYDFNAPDVTLDMLEEYLKEALKNYKIKSINAEKNTDPSDPNVYYIDLQFSELDTLTFRLYVDPSGKPRIECVGPNGNSQEYFLPLDFSQNFQIEIPKDFERSFPIDFILACMKNYLPLDQYMITENQMGLKEKLFIEQPIFEIKFRKVIRGGEFQWVKQKLNKRRRKLLTFGQRIALNLARKKAHTYSAEINRKKSKIRGDRLHLYDNPQVKTGTATSKFNY